MRQITSIVVIVIFLFVLSAFAQIDDVKFEHITSLNGLTNDHVSCIIQDYKGFMWLGTMDGLHRYDGNTFKIYKYDITDSTSISNNYILCLYEDSDSVLWIGTASGLNRFIRSSEKFIRYLHDPGNENSVSNNNIDVIYEDNKGVFWIGTYGGGLNKFDKKTGEFNSFKHDPNAKSSLSNNNVYAIYRDKFGALWIGTENGLNLYDVKNNNFIRYYHEPNNTNSLSSNIIYSIFEDDNGILWIGTRWGGLVSFDKDREIFIRHNKSFKDTIPFEIPRIIYHITQNNQDNLWLATGGNGLSGFNTKSGLYTNHKYNKHNPKSLSSNITTRVYRDTQNSFWISTKNEGLNYYNKSIQMFNNFFVEFEEFTESVSFVGSFYVDQHDSLWVGTTYGLFKIDKKTNNYIYYLHRESLKDRFQYTEEKNRNIKSVENNFYSKNNNLNIYDYPIKQIFEDNKGIIWLGTSGGGLLKCNKNKKILKRYQHKKNDANSLSSNHISHFLIDSFNQIWIVTYRGFLNVIDTKNGKVTRYTKKNREEMGLTNEYISMFYEDQYRNLWAATYGDGLFRYDRESGCFINYKHNPDDSLSLNDNMITSLFEDASGQLWIGTGNGLNKFNRESNHFYPYLTNSNHSNKYIKSILEDDHSNLWLQSSTGIIKFDSEKNTYKNYGKDDGIQVNFVKFSLDNVSYKSKEGYMYFGGKNGFVYFHPDSVRLNTHIPPIVITDFKVHNNNFKLDSSIIVKKSVHLIHNDNFFSFEFAALDYVNPKKNKYAYYLEGIDDAWIYCGNKRYANYSYIPPGEYIFHVKGTNNDGIWNEKGDSIKIIITPPWWRTYYAYAFYLFMFLVTLIVWRNFEVKKQKEKNEQLLQKEKEKAQLKESEFRAETAELQAKAAEHQARAIAAQTEVEKEQMRSRIASDLHDETGSNLSSIALISQILQKKLNPAPKEKKRLQNINRIAKMTADSMRDIIWFINPENDDLSRLIIKMRETTNLMLVDINFTFQSKNTNYSFEPDLNFKRNLFLIYKEILQNIIKHSQSQKVDINISESEKHFVLHVTDDGIGFDINKKYDGNGLKNIKNRTDQIGGKIEINSAAGKGTSIKLITKIP